jgi:hypothetical protein
MSERNSVDLAAVMEAGKGFIEDHLQQCCIEMVSLEETGILSSGFIRQAAGDYFQHVCPHQALQLAKNAVTTAAVKHCSKWPT